MTNAMNGYKNAPHIHPQIGDEVQCGPPGGTAFVVAFSNEVEGSPFKGYASGCKIINCSIDGRLYLNRPELAMLVRSVDGKTPSSDWAYKEATG